MSLGRSSIVLAEALEALKSVTEERQSAVIESSDIDRAYRQQLTGAGFLEPIMRGWYAVSKPGARRRVETVWGSVYWDFVAQYLRKRFGDEYWLDAVASLRLHAENQKVPDQLVVCATSGVNAKVELPNNTSLYIYSTKKPSSPTAIIEKGKLRILSPEATIAHLPVSAWAEEPTDAAAVLGSIRGNSTLLRAILEDGKVVRAGAVAGALRQLGRGADADAIISSLKDGRHDVRETAPFGTRIEAKFDARRPPKAAATRINLMWEKMRLDVLANFTQEPRRINDIEGYLKQIDDRYVSDAYNSLSIEGYQVSADLIEKVRAGSWKPETDANDFDAQNALAARGYWLAFNEVKKDVRKILENGDVGHLLWDRHQEWFRAMFQPFVDANIRKQYELAGYRNSPVYLFSSGHVPYSPDAVLDGMESLFDCIDQESDPRVNAVIAPFLFTYIHPYMDGNGRSARFLMNALLAKGGFPWTVIPYGRRDEYMACLEAASSKENIKPLAALVAELVATPPPPRPATSAYPARKGSVFGGRETSEVLIAGERAKRIAALPDLRKSMGARMIVGEIATEELAKSGEATIDWAQVEDRVIREAISDFGQSPEEVTEVLCQFSPGAVTDEEQAAIGRRVVELAAKLAKNASENSPAP
jgi:hypothetical protein